jgi:hypothetical protein
MASSVALATIAARNWRRVQGRLTSICSDGARATTIPPFVWIARNIRSVTFAHATARYSFPLSILLSIHAEIHQVPLADELEKGHVFALIFSDGALM